MSQIFTQTISRINSCLEILSEIPNLDSSHFQVLLALIPSQELNQSIAEYYATKEDLIFSDIHLQFLKYLPIEWDDTLLVNILCGRCVKLCTKLQRDFVLQHLNVTQQEWATDLLTAWSNALKRNVLDEVQSLSENYIAPLDIFNLFQQILLSKVPNDIIPNWWREEMIRIIMEQWDSWNKEESDFIFKNLLGQCLENNVLKKEILTWLWRICRSRCGIELKPEDNDEMVVLTTKSSIDAYTSHLQDARNVAYQILCQFFEHFFCDSELDLRMNENFWIIVIEGLKRSHSFIMKRCEYLLRRIIDLSQHDMIHDAYTKYFPIDNTSKDISNLWSIWFMLWESILSNSTHLLQPVWGQIFTFFPLRSECQPGNVAPRLHPIWPEILFHHVFNHDNFGAQKLAMASFYEFDFNKYVAPFNIEYVLDVLFNYGDFARLYADKYKIGERMIQFVLSYANQISEGLVYDPSSNPNQTVPVLVTRIIEKIAAEPLKVTYCGISYFFKLILLIKKDQLQLPGQPNLLTAEVIQQLEIIASQNVFINGAWIKIRQCALICQTIVHLGSVSRENISAISHLLKQFSRKLFLPALDKILTQHFDDEVTLNHIHDLLEHYFDEKYTLLESYNDAKTFSSQASRIARVSRFVSDKGQLLQLFSDKIGSIFDGIYSRTYISNQNKFKAITLTSTLLHEYGDSHLKSQFNMHQHFVQVLIHPYLEEILAYAGVHLAYPEITSKDDASSLYSLFKKGSQMILCDSPLIHMLESSFIYSEVLRCKPFFSFLKMKVFDSTLRFIENVKSVFGTSFVRKPEPAVGVITNLYILRALRCLSFIARASPILTASAHFGKDENIFRNAFASTYNIPYIAVSRAPEIGENASFFLIYTPSELASKLCKDKWTTIFEWFSFFKVHPSLQPDDDFLIDVMYAAQDALELVQSRHISIPIACISYILNLLKETKVPISDMKNIIDSCEAAVKGTGHGTDLESYYAYSKLLLGQKQSLDEDFVKEILNPQVTKLIKVSVGLPRITTALAIQIGTALENKKTAAEKKKVLTPFIFQLVGIEHDDISQIGHDSIEKIHSEFGTSDVDKELCYYYPPAMDYDKQAASILYLAIQNLPPNSEPFVEELLITYFNSEAKRSKARIAPNGIIFNTMIRSGKIALLASRYLTEEICERNFELFWNSINWDYIHSAKRLVDFFCVVLLSKFNGFGDRLEKELSDYNASTGVTISRLILLGSYLVYGPDNRFIGRVARVWDVLLSYSNSTHHNIRTIAQSILCSLIRRRDAMVAEGKLQSHEIPISEALRTVQQFIEVSDASMKWIAKYHPVFLFDPFISSEPEVLFYNPMEAHDKTDILDHVSYSVVESVKENIFGLSAAVCNNIERDLSRMAYYLEHWDNKTPLTSFLEDIKPKDLSYRSYVDEFVGNYLEAERPVEEVQEKNEQFNEDMNFQRKIVPWEEMDINNELNPRNAKSTERHSIIVCATFVDKIPNLAGLTRTSEIFNVETLVIASKNVLKQDMFKSISVTAEQWMPIEEVPESNLMDYLNKQKENGYQIIGLEQTADSIGIDEFKFPKKCVVLLGKEKEGIPTEYLQLLDSCVEIQQFGLIRSLNVHVSASVMIYEYTKQHYMTGKKSH